jgi:hypothetical protein
MKQLDAFVRFLYDFIVGDDWRVAVGVVIAIAVTAVVAAANIAAWWILPVAVAGLLSFTVWRAARAGSA